MIFLAFLIGCDSKTVYEARPLDSGVDTAWDTAADTGPLPADIPLAFAEYAPARASVWSPFVTDGMFLYGRRADTEVVQVSADGGTTWSEGVARNGTLVGSGGEVLLLAEAGLYRLTEGGRAEEALPLPPGVASPNVRGFRTDTDGARWLLTGDTPPALWRQPRGGAWTRVETGATSHLWLCGGRSAFTVLRDFTEALRWDGAALTSLGTVVDPSECFVTADGTVLVTEGYGPFQQARLPVGGSAPERTDLPGFATFQQADDTVLRLFDGRLEESADEGTTWTERATWSDQLTVYGVLPVADGLVAQAFGAPGVTRWDQAVFHLAPGASTWAVRMAMGAPPYFDVRDLAFGGDGRMGLLVVENIELRLLVQDRYGAWHQGPLFTQAEALSLAMSPEGDRAFVGGANGQYSLVSGDGAVAAPGSITSEFGGGDSNPISSAAWVAESWGSLLAVTTANEDDSDGHVWWVAPDGAGGNWNDVTPTRTTTSQAWRPAGYHGLAVGGATYYRSTVTSRSWYTTNGWLPNLLRAVGRPDDESLWEQEDPLWGDAPLAASISSVTDAEMLLFTERRMHVRASPMDPWRTVDVGSEPPTAAAFDAQGRLWYAKSGKLWHTETVVTGRE